mgnify:CR=1 FL=1
MEENKKEGFLDVFIQFIKFGLVGVSNTIVSGVIYFLLNTVILPGVCKLGYFCALGLFYAEYFCI